jgi:hypothetical protein
MARFSLGFTSAAAATAAALFSMRANTAKLTLWELGVFQPGTGTPTVVAGIFGKAGNTGSVSGTNQSGLWLGDSTTTGIHTVQAAWPTTAPTAPTLVLRSFSIPAVLGAGFIWAPPAGLTIAAGQDFCLWNNGGNTSLALRCYAEWEE